MDELQSIPDVKIPYASEGVIRTAQLDDTVSPANSVQLAVNMNFDRVGAIQTRPGVTQYADDLVSAINNYGTLRNSVLPVGWASLFQLGEINDITATTFRDPSAVKISDTKIAVFWKGVDGDGFAQNFSIDENTGVVLALGAPIEFDTSNADDNKAIVVATNIVLNTWRSTSSDGLAALFQCTFDQISMVAGAYTFDSGSISDQTLALVDSTHAILFYAESSAHGQATILEFNTTTGSITEPGATLSFGGTTNLSNSCAGLGDGIHFVNFWAGATGLAQCFSVNTGTWAITAIGTALPYSIGFRNNAAPIDGTHVFNAWEGAGGYLAQAFEVNAGTFAVTAVGTAAVVSAQSGNDIAIAAFSNGFDFVVFYSHNIGDGFAQLVNVDSSTYITTLVSGVIPGYDFANGGYTTGVTLGANKVMAVWGNVDALIGRAVMFESFGTPVDGKWLYAGYTDGDGRVANLPAGSSTWTDRRTGLNPANKPRFSQFLNYEWMVNGNALIGGDPVATSNGGDFGTDLVPSGFPSGDFISTGFEGRVWVANKTFGIIYYSDIVQFTPPANYTLTYNPAVNFITTLTPNTGQSITALQIVPRALLVFTEDTIYRIYGASSMDAYPGYNVGTFSQESIVTTKTGIFFHHSSGFYQFDYGSAPVEISRRIIDFVKAIPRNNYADITGVWDGFDNVEWSVGQVVVEGVVFTGCVVRYTISTQVWTIYDYKGIDITAMIYYDDGVNLNHLMGTSTGKTGQMDLGFTDFDEPFYYEFIDRWRSFTDMYYKTKRIDAVNVYHENAAGANLLYQTQEAGPNAWKTIGPVDSDTNSIIPNGNTDDFDVLRLRLVGTTKGPVIVVHGLEILQLTDKGQKKN